MATQNETIVISEPSSFFIETAAKYGYSVKSADKIEESHKINNSEYWENIGESEYCQCELIENLEELCYDYEDRNCCDLEELSEQNQIAALANVKAYVKKEFEIESPTIDYFDFCVEHIVVFSKIDGSLIRGASTFVEWLAE